MERLDAATRVDLGFPHDFLAKEQIRTLTYAGTRELIDDHRRR